MKSDLVNYDQIIDNVHPNLALFDLDSTIFNVVPRSRYILTTSLKELGLRPIHVPHFNFDWGLTQSLHRITPRLLDDQFLTIVQNWNKHFFSNSMLVHDTIYPGALNLIERFKKLNFDIGYLTGRDVHRMFDGTQHQILKYDLPLSSPQHLILKPHKDIKDTLYKKEALNSLLKVYKKVIYFDNEPQILKHLDPSPFLQKVWVKTQHSGKCLPGYHDFETKPPFLDLSFF